MYSCQEVLAQLQDFLDEEITPEIRREIVQHVSECRTCRVILDSTRKTLRIVTESRSFELPESVSERIMSRILTAVDPGRRGPS